MLITNPTVNSYKLLDRDAIPAYATWSKPISRKFVFLRISQESMLIPALSCAILDPLLFSQRRYAMADPMGIEEGLCFLKSLGGNRVMARSPTIWREARALRAVEGSLKIPVSTSFSTPSARQRSGVRVAWQLLTAKRRTKRTSSLCLVVSER